MILPAGPPVPLPFNRTSPVRTAERLKLDFSKKNGFHDEIPEKQCIVSPCPERGITAPRRITEENL